MFLHMISTNIRTVILPNCHFSKVHFTRAAIKAKVVSARQMQFNYRVIAKHPFFSKTLLKSKNHNQQRNTL